MAEPRSRRTGEHNAEIVKLMADAVAMRDRLNALEARVVRLEAELASARKSVKPPPGASTAPRPASRRPAGGPPPLPSMMPAIPKQSGRRSVVDISEIAELVESMPPPAPRSKK